MKKETEWLTRLKLVFKISAGILAIGIAYGMFVKFTGLGIPCPIRFLTGFKCPGCGVTHMCIAIMQLDFAAAYESNQALFILTPILGILFLQYIWNYVKTGNQQLGKLTDCILYMCAAVLIVFGILRNILPL